MNQMYNINIKPIVLTVRPEINKRYLLSSDKNDWICPTLPLDKSLLGSNNFENNLIQKMKDLVFTNDLELIPQIIKINNGSQSEELDIIYGFIIPYTESLNNCFWIEFDFTIEKPYSQLIIEVAQKLV